MKVNLNFKSWHTIPKLKYWLTFLVSTSFFLFMPIPAFRIPLEHSVLLSCLKKLPWLFLDLVRECH